MPLYLYHSETTGFEVEVLRSFEEYKIPPLDDELPEEQRGIEHVWVRHLGIPLYTSKWPSSTGSVKGRA